MNAIFEVALPFFALIFLGYAAVRSRLLPAATVPGLNGFVFYVTLPALLFDKIASAPIAELADWRFLVVYYVPTLTLLLGVTGVSLWLLRTPARFAVVQGMSTCWANTGYMGIPLLLTFAGPQAALPAVLITVCDQLLTGPIALAVLEGRNERAKLATTLVQTARGLARHPLILATLAGILGGLAPFAAPTPVAAVIDLLAGATVACALFALGGSLVGVPISEAKREIAVLAFLKLLVHPALVAVMAYLVLPLSAPMAMGAVICAALPTAASVYVIAQRYETYVLRSSTAILVSHALSVLTVSVLLVAYAGARG